MKETPPEKPPDVDRRDRWPTILRRGSAAYRDAGENPVDYIANFEKKHRSTQHGN